MKKSILVLGLVWLLAVFASSCSVAQEKPEQLISKHLTALEQETGFLTTWTPSDRETLYELFTVHGASFAEGSEVIHKETWNNVPTALRDGYSRLLGSPVTWSNKQLEDFNELINCITQRKGSAEQ